PPVRRGTPAASAHRRTPAARTAPAAPWAAPPGGRRAGRTETSGRTYGAGRRSGPRRLTDGRCRTRRPCGRPPGGPVPAPRPGRTADGCAPASVEGAVGLTYPGGRELDAPPRAQHLH